MIKKDTNFKVTGIQTEAAARELIAAMRNICTVYGVCHVGDMYDLLLRIIPDEHLAQHKSFWTLEDLKEPLIIDDIDRGDCYIKFPLPRDKRDAEPIKAAKPDMVAHPPHYQTASGLETIDVIEAFTSELKGIEATDTGNVIKYICRWGKKNGLEDLEKAQWYLNHLINKVKERLKKEKMQHE